MNKRLVLGAALAAIAFSALPLQAAKVKELDRAGLIKLADDYVAALVAHKPSMVPLSKDLKFVENVTRMKVGEGLWKTASAGPTTFKITVPDPVSQQVGYMAVMQSDGKPAQVVVRLKVVGGKIVEAEHLVAGNLRDTSLKNLERPRPAFRIPVASTQRNSHDELIAIAKTYYDALVKGEGKLSPLADDCVRRENGMQTTGNPPAPAGSATPAGMSIMGAMGCSRQLDTKTMSYIDSIDNRRVEIADTETGLAFGLSHFRHSMKKDFVQIVGVPGVDKIDMKFKAFDLPAAHIYKIAGGKIHEIEAMGFTAPYMSKTGWE